MRHKTGKILNNKESGCAVMSGSEERLSGKKVLVVDDNCIIALHLSQLLTRLGCLCVKAQTGFEAIEIIKDDSGVDAVLLDLEMPYLDGVATMKIIKEIKKKIPVIANTGYCDEYCTDTLLCSGFDDVISKPIQEFILVDKIDKLLSRFTGISDKHN